MFAIFAHMASHVLCALGGIFSPQHGDLKQVVYRAAHLPFLASRITQCDAVIKAFLAGKVSVTFK